jgi:hypothetical protein
MNVRIALVGHDVNYVISSTDECLSGTMSLCEGVWGVSAAMLIGQYDKGGTLGSGYTASHKQV